jgi:hypothetical protein
VIRRAVRAVPWGDAALWSTGTWLVLAVLVVTAPWVARPVALVAAIVGALGVGHALAVWRTRPVLAELRARIKDVEAEAVRLLRVVADPPRPIPQQGGPVMGWRPALVPPPGARPAIVAPGRAQQPARPPGPPGRAGHTPVPGCCGACNAALDLQATDDREGTDA